jgi:hypothetical protein
MDRLEHFNQLETTLKDYYFALSMNLIEAKKSYDSLAESNLTKSIHKVNSHLKFIDKIKSKETTNGEIRNSTPDNICWALDDDAEKVILYFDLGENIESGRYLIIGGHNINKFINNEKFDYWVSDNIFPIDKTYSMELTHEEVELIKKHRNENK